MKSAFGLDIGAITMKAVWLTPQPSGFLLNASGMHPTPPKGFLSESPLDQQEIAQSIRNFITETKITTPYVNIALAENQVYTKVLDMPVLSDKELSSAIFWEAEQYIPVPLKDVTLDYAVLKKPQATETSSKMQVLLVAAPTILIQKYQRLLEMAGLIPKTIESETLSVVRAIVLSDQFPNTLIIHTGAITTLLAIVKDGTIVFTYLVPVGGSAITRAIASNFGFSLPQAEQYKRIYGYSSKTLEGKIGRAIEPILFSMLSEVKKALAYYSDKFSSDPPLKQIIITGGTAKLAGIDLFFAKHSGIETAIGNPWRILSSQQVPKSIIDNAPDYTVAVGLASKGYEGH